MAQNSVGTSHYSSKFVVIFPVQIRLQHLNLDPCHNKASNSITNHLVIQCSRPTILVTASVLKETANKKRHRTQ